MSMGFNKVFIFPGTGSCGTEFSYLHKELRPNINIIQYPNDKVQGPLGIDNFFNKYIDLSLQQIQRLRPEQIILVGHSMGAYVAYYTALELEKLNFRVSRLVVLGANPPKNEGPSFIPPKNSAEVEEYFNSIDPTLLGRLTDKELRNIILNKAVVDLNALSEFYKMEHSKTLCPITVISSDLDPLTMEAKLKLWANYTEGESTFLKGESRHFELPSDPTLLLTIRNEHQSNSNQINYIS